MPHSGDGIGNARVILSTQPFCYSDTAMVDNATGSFEFQNATFRSAGIDLDEDDGIDEGIGEGDIAGGGFAMDFGAQYYFNDKWNWKLINARR